MATGLSLNLREIGAGVERGVRKTFGGLEVEIHRHGRGFRAYRCYRTEKKGTTLRRLPRELERRILDGYAEKSV